MPDLPALAAVPPLAAPDPRPAVPTAEPVERGRADTRPDAEPPRPVAARPPPIAVDVARGSQGIFVYTLRDPATDTVLAVIPRDAVRPDREGRNVDERA